MRQFARSIFTNFVDLLFPETCLICNQKLDDDQKTMCIACRIKLPETGQHRSRTDINTLNKFAGKVPIRFLASYLYFSKGGSVQKLIHQIKYNDQKEAAQTIAGWYGHQLLTESSLLADVDLLVGVPLHKSRLRQRGYNQADYIASGLADAVGIPARSDVLSRVKFRGSQTRRNRIERWENVKEMFAVTNAEAIKDKNVVVIDDVMTTGATIEACAAELLNAGCRSVGVLTLAATR